MTPFEPVIEMAHGAGGRATQSLIDTLFKKYFRSAHLAQSLDFAAVPVALDELVIATDSHVVTPLFFPGGDIGRLSIFGTVNDVAMSGAVPRYLSASFILEEGLSYKTLEQVVSSMADAAQRCNVEIVTGDTKVVERGLADGLYINTTGVGFRPSGRILAPSEMQVGDQILVSGAVGDHGAAIVCARESEALRASIQSDCQPVHRLVRSALEAAPQIRVMRDPTRGGLGACLNELAAQSGKGIRLKENAIPVREPVRNLCELLGLDALALANEGKVVLICPAQQSAAVLKSLRAHPEGQDAAIIGEVFAWEDAHVVFETAVGGERLLDWQWADPLPRMC